jgi:hypothetical protein
MTADKNHRPSLDATGFKPVGFLNEISDIEAVAISLLRSWRNGNYEQFEMTSKLILYLGKEKGFEARSNLNELCKILFYRSRRNFICHNSDCYCIGAHEAYFANIILALANEDMEGAEILASLFLEANIIGNFLEIAKIFSATAQLLKKRKLNIQIPNHLRTQIQ